MSKNLSLIGIIALSLGLYSCSKIPFNNEKELKIPAQIKLTSRPKLAIVLGGGGVKGLAHLGVLHELQKAGIEPDLIVGCSAGAMIGAMYASVNNLDKLTAELLVSNRNDVISYELSAFSMYSNTKMMNYLSRHVHARTFEQLRIPLIVVAASLQFGELIPFSKGPLLKPVMASSSLPGIFYPVEIDGHYYVDGGVISPLPVYTARQYNPEVVLAINISENLPETSPTNVLGLVQRSLEIAYINQIKNSAKDADLVINFAFKDVGSFNDGKNSYLYNAGRNAAKIALPNLKKLLAGKK
jgi:NTE family protein